MKQQITTVEAQKYQTYDRYPKEHDVDVKGSDSKHNCLFSKNSDVIVVKRTHNMISSQLAEIMTGPGAAEEAEVNEINPTLIFHCYSESGVWVLRL